MSESPKRGRKSSAGRSSKAGSQSLFSPKILDAVPDATIATNSEGRILYANKQTGEMFGYSPEDLIGQPIEVLVPERYRERHRGHRADYGEQPKVRRMGAGLDLYGRRRDGSEFPVEISLSPVQAENESLVISAIRDISDRKQIEEDLRRANEELAQRTDRELWDYRTRLAAIVDSSEDAIIGKDLQGIVTDWNHGAERMYGYTAEEIVGKPLATILPNDRKDEVENILKRIRGGESVKHFESVRVGKDGKPLNVSITVSPIRDTAGNIVGASTIARNITEQRKAEDQLRQAQKMEAVGRLAGGVAHDFNNILGIIVACSELLRDRIAASPGLFQYVDNIRKASDRGSNLTRQLLAFSRKRPSAPIVLDLTERLRDITKLLRPLMGDDVEVVLINHAEAALIEADPGQIDQIVMNLAVNARDAMPGGGKLILETSIVKFDDAFARQHPPMTAGDYVLLAVSDSGTGMDQETLSRIFEPFFTTKEVGKGTGLGLATVYGIVQQSGGHVFVYSEPGQGSTFKIYLPSAEEKITEDSFGEQAAELARVPEATILIVEDDELIRSLTRQMLEEHGYRVFEASDGVSALKLVHTNGGHFDLVLTDVVMKGMRGPELVKQLNQSNMGIKVIYMSGYTGELMAERDIRDSGSVLLEKPFTRAALLRAVYDSLK